MTTEPTGEGPGPAPTFDRSLGFDVVVVGAGSAGLTAALELASSGAGDGTGTARPLRVAVVTKARFGHGGSSVWAQGGVAAAVGPGDSPALHAADTLAAAAGLAVPEAVEALTGEGPERVLRLLALGAGFDRAPDGSLALGREAAHGERRILHARGDATGAEIMAALTAAVAACPSIKVLEETFAWDLHLERDRDGTPRVAGVTAVGCGESTGAGSTGAGSTGDDSTTDGSTGRESTQSRPVERLFLRAPAVVLATGGIGRLWAHTTNPEEVTGDGLAMAARAGARLVDLEMVQFHPTALAVPGADPQPLLTEALRGEGAVLLARPASESAGSKGASHSAPDGAPEDAAGHRFLLDEHPDAELAPRDVVARAIDRRRAAGDEVVLDAREAVGEAFPERFPTVFAACRAHGIDPRREPMPVSPAAHYHMGGIATDLDGRTSLAGLWACGEAASTGVHGANRLASNSLLESLVFGTRVAASVRRAHPGPIRLAVEPTPPPAGAGRRPSSDAGRTAVEALRRRAWRHLGLTRDAEGLATFLAETTLAAKGLAETGPDGASSEAPSEVELGGEGRNLRLVGRLVAEAAAARTESRGGHFRRDHPETDPAWRRRLVVDLKPGHDGSEAVRIEASAPLAVPSRPSRSGGGERR